MLVSRSDTALMESYSRGLQAKFYVQNGVLDKLPFADDMAENVKTVKNARGGGSRFTSMWQLWPHNQHKKTEVVYQPAPGQPYSEPTITVNGQKLLVVDKFTYL